MAISMQQVKELRDRTQAGLNDCKNALGEADGDIDKAIEIILKKGLAKSAKRAGAAASEGEVAERVADDKKSAVLVEVNIQTDFAARNDDFRAFVQDVVKVASGAEDGADLGGLPYPGSSETVEHTRKALVGRLGENITVRRWGRLRVEGEGCVHAYVHMGGKIGALLAVQVGDAGAMSKPEFSKFLDDTAMQIAAMGPQWLSPAEVPEDAKAKQSNIFAGQLEEEGKPEAARPKIIEGKLAKWMKEVCLLPSASVIESGQSVEQVCKATAEALGTDLTVVGMLRYERGEGVEKGEEKDFAEEARQMAGN